MKFDNELIEQFRLVYHHANLPTYRITLFNERQQEQILQLIDDIYHYPDLMAQIMNIILKTITNLNIITKQKQTYTKFLHFPGCGSSLLLQNVRIQAQSFYIKLGIIISNKNDSQENLLSSSKQSALSFNFQKSMEDHSMIANCQYITLLQLNTGSKTLLFQLDQQQKTFVITVIFEMLHQYDFQFHIPGGINLNNWNKLKIIYQDDTFFLSINKLNIKQQNKQKVDFHLNNIDQIVIGSDAEIDNNLNQDQYRGVSKSFLDCSYINSNEYFSGQICNLIICQINQNKKLTLLKLQLQHAHQIWEADQLKENILNSQFLLDNKQTNQCRLFKYDDIIDKGVNRFSCFSQNVFLLDVYGFIDIFMQNGGLNLIYGCLDMLNYIINQIHINKPNYLQKEEKLLQNLITNCFEIIYQALEIHPMNLDQFLKQGYLFVELIMNKSQFFNKEFNDNINDHFITLLLKAKMLNLKNNDQKFSLSEIVNVIQDSSSQLGMESANYILEQFKLTKLEKIQFEILDLFVKLFKIQLVNNIIKDHISAFLSDLLKKPLFTNINQQNSINYLASIIKYPDLGTLLFYLIPSQIEKSLIKKSISEKQIEQIAINPRMKCFEILTYLFTYLIEQTQLTQFRLWELHSHFLSKDSFQVFLEISYNQVIQYIALYGMQDIIILNNNDEFLRQKTENLIFVLLHIEKCVSEINSDHIRFDFFWKLLEKFMIMFNKLGILFGFYPQDMANVLSIEHWKIELDSKRLFLNGGIRRIIIQLMGQFICQVGSYQAIQTYVQLLRENKQANPNTQVNRDLLFKAMLPNLINETMTVRQEVTTLSYTQIKVKLISIWKFDISYLIYRIVECQEFEDLNESQLKNLNEVIQLISKLNEVQKIQEYLYNLSDFKQFDTDFQFESYDLNKLVKEYSKHTKEIAQTMDTISKRSKSDSFGDKSFKLPTIKDLLEYNVHYTQKENIRKIIYHTSYKQFEFIHQVWLKLHSQLISESNVLNQINFDQAQSSLQSIKSATSSENRVKQQSKSKIQGKWDQKLFELKSKNSFFYYLQEDLESLYLELNKFLKQQEFNFEIFDKIKNKYKVSSLEDGIRRRQQLIQIRASESKKPYILGTQRVTAISSKKKLQQVDSSLEKSPVLSGKSPLEQFYDDETSLSQSLSSLKKSSRKSQQSLGLIQPELVIAPSFSGIRLRKGSDLNSKNVETSLFSFPCEYIQQEGGIPGELLIIINKDKAKLKFRSSDLKQNYIITCPEKVQLNAEIQFSVDISEIKYVFTRRFMMIEVAIEIFYEQSTQFFNFFEENKRKTVLDKLKQLKIPCIVNRIEEFKKKDFTNKWKQGNISNFEYLMLINTYSGRTYNDLTQYFIFPWIIKEFRSHALHLDKRTTYRDLSAPVGAQDHHRLVQLKERYNSRNKANPDEEMLYGSHYSNSTIVVNYLLRLEPFNEFHFKLQKNKFDIPDRLFSSIEIMWENSKCQDQKELIPEFYYMPEFLQNINDFDFGSTQSHVRVQNVLLPYWVKTKTAEEFVYIMRQALESRYVSQKLNDWIDLIFGCKQQGKQAEQSNNLFHYLTYESNVVQKYNRQDPDFAAFLPQIYYCGQTPFQLFKNSHEQKKFSYNYYNVKQPIFAEKGLLYEHHAQTSIIFNFFLDKQAFLVTNKFTLIKLQSVHYFNFLLAQNQQFQFVEEISLGKVDEDQCNPLSLFTFVYQRSEEFIDKVDSQFHSLISSQITSLYIAVGGFNDSSFTIINLSNKKSSNYIKHTKKVSCIKFHCQTQILAVGSFDCTISLYKLQFQNTENILENPFHYIKSHRAPITCLDMSDTYILSVDNYFHCYVHTIKGSHIQNKDKFESNFCQKLHHIVLMNEFQIYQCLIHPAQFYIFKGKRGQFHFYTFNAIPYIINFDLSQEETQNIVFLTPFSQYFLSFNTKSSNLSCINIFDLKLIQQSCPTEQQYKQDLNNIDNVKENKPKKSKKKINGISSVQIIIEPESLDIDPLVEEVYLFSSENSLYWLKQSKQSKYSNSNRGQNKFLAKHLSYAGLLVSY